MSCTGKIRTLIPDGNNPYGFILPDVNINGQTRDPVFWVNDVIGCLFSDLSVGDIVQFHPVDWVRRNGDIQIIARQVQSRMSGVIKFIRVDPINQKFWGRIQPDNNWLNQTERVIFFSDSFQEQTLHNFIDFCGQSFNQNVLDKFIDGIRVDFAIQHWSNANNPNITKVAKDIKLIDTKSVQLPVPPTKLLKDKISNFLDKIEIVSNPFEFEDLVFNLLRLIGINKIYQYDRNKSAGRADGFFMSGNLAVLYDCTLRNPYMSHKKTQIFNYKEQLKQASSITIHETRSNGKVIKKTLVIPKNREVWIITRGNTSVIQQNGNICVKEVSVKSLIDAFNQKLDSQIFGELW